MNKNLLFSITELELKTLLEPKYATANNAISMLLLQGLCFNNTKGQLESCGLDGYRLSKRAISINDDKVFNFILDHDSTLKIHRIPKKTNDMVNVYLINTNIVEFEFIGQDKIINCNLMHGEYMKYNSIIPNEFKLELKVKSNEIIEAIRDIKKEKVNIVKLFVKDDKMIIKCQPTKEEYDEKLSLEMQHKQQNQYDIEWKLKHDKWIEKVNKAKINNSIVTVKEPVRKIAKFHKSYKTILLDELIYEFDCLVNKPDILKDEFKIAFNPKYLYEAVKQYKGDIVLKFNSSINPCIITQNNNNLELVLPVRIKD